MLFVDSLTKSVYSSEFYADARKKGIKKAFGVFVLFALVTAIITSSFFVVSSWSGIKGFKQDISDFPDVRVDGEGLHIDGVESPLITAEDGKFFAADPTGTITDIPDIYQEGIVFGKEEIVFKSTTRAQHQRITYPEALQYIGKESLTITSESLKGFADLLGMSMIFVAPIFVFVANLLSRGITILLITLLGFVVLSTKKIDNAFNKSLLVTIYASIPVFYFNFIFSVFGKVSTVAFGVSLIALISSACCLIPLIIALAKWGVFWTIGMKGVEPELFEKKVGKK